MSELHPFLRYDGVLAFAHQGGNNEHPENTMAAFQNAVGLGYRYLETDAQVTSDGVLICMHDETLDRMTDREGTISDMPWEEVRQAKITGGHPIVRLDELWETFPGIRVNIDAKSNPVVEPLIAWFEKVAAFDRLCLGSFGPKRLGRFRKHFGSKLCTALGIIDVGLLRLNSWGIPLPGVDGDAAQVSVKQEIVGPIAVPITDRRFVEKAHDKGIHVHVWTIDEADEMNRLLDLGVDGLMTDSPTLLKQVLVERGQWGG
jgi:glycerophosphoryl diester phosphodiesterase